MPVKPKVLVCDDDAINLEVVQELLRDDYEVETVLSGEACVAKLAEFHPEVILLDVMMPGLDGYETCRRIVATSNGSVPQIIFVSARVSTEDRLKGYEAGADDYISKPFDHDELRAKVRIHARLRIAIVGLEKAKQDLEAHRNDLVRLVTERTTELQSAKERLEDVARELASSNVELALQARLDPLTRLLNRNAWDEIADREQERSQRYGHSYSVMMIDVDHFKAYNDSQNHHAGDVCLRRIAHSIVTVCRTTEFVGRYGGEEFVVLAPETCRDDAHILAERVRNAITELDIPHPASPTADQVTVSIGIASATGRAWGDILKDADKSLYDAKRNGRNRVCAAQPPAGVTSSER